MDAIQRAAHAVDAFTNPGLGFRWGSSLDAPDPNDKSPEAATKRAILLAAAEHRACPGKLFDENLYETAQRTIECWPVQQDWLRYLNAIEYFVYCQSLNGYR